VLNPKICSEETLRKVRAMLEGVVLDGTAKAIKSPDFSMAGKTGTAWKFKNGQYTKTYSTSFCGYFPADKPKYSCIVVVDSPKRGRIYGSDVAAPVFREVADKAMARDIASQRPLLARVPLNKTRIPTVKTGLQDELTLVCQKLGVDHQSQAAGEEWVRADTNTRALSWQAQPVRRGQVPDVSGMTMRDALFLLENRGLRVRIVGNGRVYRQSVAAGTPLRRGTTVVLELQPIGSLAGSKPQPPPARTKLAENKLLTPADPDPAKQRAKMLLRQEQLKKKLQGEESEPVEAKKPEVSKDKKKVLITSLH
jgi:cell division protein FtsI (penicillin-binding protein 3)